MTCLAAHSLPQAHIPNAKVVQSLARAALKADVCEAKGDGPADATVNERLKRHACMGRGDSANYEDIIGADPVGTEQLLAPQTARTAHTAEGHAYPAAMGAPLPPANDARVATLLAMGTLDKPPSPKIGAHLHACMHACMQT
jgi:hypothetical protein